MSMPFLLPHLLLSTLIENSLLLNALPILPKAYASTVESLAIPLITVSLTKLNMVMFLLREKPSRRQQTILH